VLIAVIPLALLAAVMYSYSDYLEQRVASRTRPAQGSRSGLLGLLSGAASMMRRLTRDRTWAIGWLIGTLALFVQAAALHLGSIAVVQTLQVTSLLWAIPLTARSVPYGPSVWDYVGAGLLGAGLICVVAVRGAASGSAEHQRPSVLLFVLIAAVVVGLVALALDAPRPMRVTILAIAAGVAYGCSAALIKLTTQDLASVGIPGTATDWPGYALALSTATGTVVQQLSFASGRLAAATTAIFVANPLTGYVIAVLGFGERLPHSPGRLAGLAVSGFCAAAGVAVLAHSRLLFGTDSVESASGPAGSSVTVERWPRGAVGHRRRHRRGPDLPDGEAIDGSYEVCDAGPRG
jgi:hypothetical protein